MAWLKGSDDDGPGVHTEDDRPDWPTNDNGLNYVYSILTFPLRAGWLGLRVASMPLRFLIGVVSARRVDEEIAKRGMLYGEENFEVVEEVLNEYGRKFVAGGRDRR